MTSPYDRPDITEFYWAMNVGSPWANCAFYRIGKHEVIESMKTTRSFSIFVDLDSVTVVCPCGASITDEGSPITEFKQAHAHHTDGTCVSTVTDDGARCLAQKPEPKTYRI